MRPLRVCRCRLVTNGRCSLAVGFTPDSLVVQSSCAPKNATRRPHHHVWVQCPSDAGDCNSSVAPAARGAGFCYNVSTAGSTANASLVVFLDRIVAEVFASLPGGEPGPVVSSGVLYWVPNI